MPELTPTDPWAATTDAAGVPWRSSLAEALRANGFETTPPPLDDEADTWPLVAPAASDPDQTADGTDAMPLDADPDSAWWLDAAALPPSGEAGPVMVAPEPVAPEPELLAPEPELPAPKPGPATSAAVTSPATAAPPTVSGAPPRAVNTPATASAANPPSPPAFLAGRIARGAAPAESPAESPAQPEPRVVAIAAPEIAAPEIAAQAAPAPAAPEVADQAAPAPAPAAPAPAAPEVAPHAVLDPRDALVWREPTPLTDEGWPAAPLLPVPGAFAGTADPTLAPAKAPARGFTWDDAAAVVAPAQDPWAGVRYSASDAPSPDVDTRPDGSGPHLAVPPVDTAATASVDPATDEAPEAAAGPEAPVDDLAQLRAQATAWLEAEPATEGDATDMLESDPIAEVVLEPDPAPAANTPDWIVKTAAAHTRPVAPSDAPAPEIVAADAAMSGGSPVDLDPRRVEFIGYTAIAPGAAPADGASRPIPPPTGSILDVGRRPPGAKPVDPSTLGTRSATAGAALANEPLASTPGATGADLWDLVTAPTPPPFPTNAPGRGSRAVTVLLSVLVAFVILALVVGFLYSFTGLL